MAAEEGFLFTWIIENFHMWFQKSGDKVSSPVFLWKQFGNTELHLDLYPRGTGENFRKYFMCCMRTEDDTIPKSIAFHLKMTLNSSSEEHEHYFNRAPDNFMYFPRGEVNVHAKFCKVQCLMRMNIHPKDQNLKCFSHLLEPYALPPEICIQLVPSASKEHQGLLEKFVSYPNKCSGRTRISVEKKSIVCQIKKILHHIKTGKYHLPVLSCSGNPSLCISLEKTLSDEEDNFEVKIHAIDKLLKNTFLICKMQIVYPSGESHDLAKSSHLFDCSEVHEIWRFENPFQCSELKKHETADLYFRFSISEGSFSSNIEYAENQKYSSTLYSENTIFDDLFRFYNEQKFCDVTLQTRQKTFEAHKIVLCAMSPVFDVMFESGMKESCTNKVFIDDLDSDTVSGMILFMYSGTVEPIDCNKAINLFSAADKYQIDALKKICRHFLKKNLSVENICSVLSLADAHEDKELKQSCVSFISIYKSVIFSTHQWEYFAGNNAELVAEILQKVCSYL